ncbi:MAG: DUF1653 domain-containing protein [Betaproteobacteria bacterium]
MNADTESRNVMKTGRYRHYKGKEYEVLAVAKHTESGEYVVVYRALYGDYALWVRPREMFLGTVQVHGQEVPRFEYIGRRKKSGVRAKGIGEARL